MCGIAGVYGRAKADRTLLLAMAGEMRHRGPDGVGLYMDRGFGMVNTRLAVVDLAGGGQPLSCGHGRYWAMQNGEIYNHVELAADLRRLGHRFATSSDTEVIAHAYDEWGPRCLERFNGDFAIAVWDRVGRELFLARDRFGVRPLFVSDLGGEFRFASEAKALLRHRLARRELDPVGVVDSFTTWSTLPDRSAFVGIRELAPAHWLKVRPQGASAERRWWDIAFASRPADEAKLVEELEDVLADAIRLRLRADVPVATYLSGGLDSSAIAAIAAGQRGADRLSAFGVGFTDARYDESAAQDRIAAHLRTPFHRTHVDAAAIAESFPSVVRLAERPLMRTAPAPLLRLSAAVRERGLKVVLTGEGADELFAGYDIFREDALRRFWARDPSSPIRPLLFARLNLFLATDPARSGAFLAGFYGRGLLDTEDPLYSHRLRFVNTARCLRLLSHDLTEYAGGDLAPTARLVARLPAAFGSFSPLARAQYLEMVTFLEGYLLHAQGDRMLMGSSIEGRFPFLDHRVAEFAARLPDSLRLRGLREKYALRRAVARHLPDDIRARPKVPYRAPIREVFFGAHTPDYVSELLEPAHVRRSGLFDAAVVDRVTAKFRRPGSVSETDEMALVGCLSLLLLHEQMIVRPELAAPGRPSRIVIGDRVIADHGLDQEAEAA